MPLWKYIRLMVHNNTNCDLEPIFFWMVKYNDQNIVL